MLFVCRISTILVTRSSSSSMALMSVYLVFWLFLLLNRILADRFMTIVCVFFFFFKKKTAYEMRIRDWSSDVCSSDLVLSLIVILVGLVSYDRLTIREYPKIDAPVVSVTTEYQGASAEIIESQITQVLEEVLAGIEGIDFMTSISRQERSQISITFNLDRDPSAAAADVRDRVGRARSALPDEVDEPVIQKVEADAQPTIYLAFSRDRPSPMDLTAYADRSEAHTDEI